jgi:hypothetical protein
MPDYNEEEYRDDRMYIMAIFPADVESDEDGNAVTTIFYDKRESESIWSIVTFKNTIVYRLISVMHFRSLEDAIRYKALVDPTVPLITQKNTSNIEFKSQEIFEEWKIRNNLKEFDYRDLFMDGSGENPRDIVIQKKGDFLEGINRANKVLGYI